MEDALLINPSNPVVKAGAENIFVNFPDSTDAFNNIERVDFITPKGITAPSTYLDKIGFLLLDRGGDDPLQIAAITKLDPDPKKYAYGPVVGVGAGIWVGGTPIAKTNVHSDECGNKNLNKNIVASTSNQKLAGVFVSYQDLGISAGQTFYGYSVVGNDVTVPIKQFSTFPKNTGSIPGGWDMTAGGGIVAYNPVANDDTATTPANTPVTINVLSNDTAYVFSLDPGTIDLDPSTSGQQTSRTFAGQGTYTVNLSTGEVTFTPDPGFTGIPTPIKYTVKDTKELISNEATITITVTPASTPTPTPTPTPTKRRRPRRRRRKRRRRPRRAQVQPRPPARHPPAKGSDWSSGLPLSTELLSPNSSTSPPTPTTTQGSLGRAEPAPSCRGPSTCRCAPERGCSLPSTSCWTRPLPPLWCAIPWRLACSMCRAACR
jgi:CshA-type fibril repeat protein